MGDVRKRIAIFSLPDFQLLQYRIHSDEMDGMVPDKLLQNFQVPPIELNQSPPHQSAPDQFHISRTHGQKRQQGQSGPEIHGHQPLFRILFTAAFQAVGLTFPGTPLVLTREFNGPHLMEQRNQLGHETFLGPVLRGTQVGGINLFSPPPSRLKIEVIIHLQAPGPSIHPVTQLATASQARIRKRGMHPVHGIFTSHCQCGTTPDQGLPQRTRSGSRWIHFKLKRPLKSNPVQQVTKQSRKARRGDQDLHGRHLAHSQSPHRLITLHFQDADTVHLACETPAHEALDLKTCPAAPRGKYAFEIQIQYMTRLIPTTAQGTQQAGGKKFFLKMTTYPGIIFFFHLDSRPGNTLVLPGKENVFYPKGGCNATDLRRGNLVNYKTDPSTECDFQFAFSLWITNRCFPREVVSKGTFSTMVISAAPPRMRWIRARMRFRSHSGRGDSVSNRITT